MEKTNKDFLSSLDLTDSAMEMYIPYVLQDLTELGSIPEYIYRLISDNVNMPSIENIIDLGCGKGAVLIYLANRIDFKGIGVDIVSEFIESANQQATSHSFNNRIEFVTDNLLNYTNRTEQYDILIYGYDSEILGNVYQTIEKLSSCIKNSGYLVLEIAFTPDSKKRIAGLPAEKELMEQLNKSCLNIKDHIYWDIDTIKSINERNNKLIGKRIEELKEKFPQNNEIFTRYMNNQIEECFQIENDMICATWILKKQ